MSFDFLHLTDRLERIAANGVALRPVAFADAWPLFDATRDPLFNRHLLWPAPDRPEAVQERIAGMLSASRQGRLTALSAVVRDTGEWISLFRFLPTPRDPGSIEMGLWTHPRFWNSRHSLGITRLCIDAAFEASSVGRLIAQSADHNRASCRLLQTAGLQPGPMVMRGCEDGSDTALREFAITRAQWRAAKQPRPQVTAAGLERERERELEPA